ncbi:hypothetical protein PHSY_005479 [Pseudozyma hubeiensis SY62]|uniref:Uncharacterized protein n=1 Tax=Pseudozyma hubeiensis (strain SY62) TaxID=1305764 RepID=R9P959_PSEHS|nr:hypothetical protein PHSY_005479 [Pseudozyma hubeiensis SY62]GAC97891.1 hypothetical protein PHSY_005479 [Pseudozyma hubeiensis SY62]
MRRSQGILPAQDACRSWLQPTQQRRVLSSAAVYPGYAWPASSSTSASTSSPASPLSLSHTKYVASFSKAKGKRPGRSLFAFAYSTSNPAYPLPGSNNEIDPRGVDYSLFEPEDDAYTQHASTSAVVHRATVSERDDFFTATPASTSSSSLSAPSQLLVRLIDQQDFETATTVLNELLALKSPLTEPLPVYSTAALWSIRHGRKKDMLAWMRLCPGYAPGTKHLNTASTTKNTSQARSIANNFRKCFMVLLDSHGDDLRLLQQASMVAAQKGMWSVLQATLAQILRFGTGRIAHSNVSNPELAWEYFHRLVLANQSQRGLKDEALRPAILAATLELRSLYNLGIRTLALAGRLEDAIHWAQKCVEVGQAQSALAQILLVEPFTENLLMEELVKADGYFVEQARTLAQGLARSPARLERHRATDVDAVVARINREAAFRTEESDYAQRPASGLDSAIQTCLEQGDVIAAREHLLSVLRSVTRVRSGEDDVLPEYDEERSSVFAHLPSARVLSELQDTVYKLGTIAVTSSLTETDMHHTPDPESLSGSMQESLTAESFLRPVRIRLSSVRGGRGLWETARLYGLVKKGRWKEAAHFYTGKAGFKIPSGGISNELVSLALDQATSPQVDQRDELDEAQSMRGKHWPSTHAINLMLKALVGICVDAQDYARLQQVYAKWKESSLPTTAGGELSFDQWPPSQRPSSFTLDPFVRAFARLEFTSPDQQVEKWGSSEAVLDVIRDMTEAFRVRPSISTWTIALDCLAREGRERWGSTTEVLTRAVGIRTVSSLEQGWSEQETREKASFPPATLATYTALMRALVRVPQSDGGSMIDQAAAVRDDLLARTVDLDAAARGVDGSEDEVTFWNDLLTRWTAIQEALQQREGLRDDRERWDGVHVVKANQGRTLEVLKEVWMLECARVEDEEAGM